jgi:hypothetical protein
VHQRERFIRLAFQGADRTLRIVRNLMGGDTTTFVASDHGFAPQFLAIDASKVLVDLGLLSKPQTSNCRPASGETIGKAKACWAGATVQIYLNLAGRDPATSGLQQVPAAEADAAHPYPAASSGPGAAGDQRGRQRDQAADDHWPERLPRPA